MESMDGIIKNRVAESGLITLDPEMFRPKDRQLEYDLRKNLFLDQILKEKDFRQALLETDWTLYKGAQVAIFCSVEAIIPLWAFMLLAGYLEPYAKGVFRGNLSEMESYLWHMEIQAFNFEEFRNKRVVVKGCGDLPIPESVYVELTLNLRPIVKNLMFGEPCSTVPLFKN